VEGALVSLFLRSVRSHRHPFLFLFLPLFFPEVFLFLFLLKVFCFCFYFCFVFVFFVLVFLLGLLMDSRKDGKMWPYLFGMGAGMKIMVPAKLNCVDKQLLDRFLRFAWDRKSFSVTNLSRGRLNLKVSWMKVSKRELGTFC